MQTAYQILGVPIDADDDDIKQAYLRKIRDNPPDHNQDKFRQINQAYNAIKDHKSRLSHALFDLPEVEFGQLIDQVIDCELNRPVPAKDFIEILLVSIDENNLLDSLKTDRT